MICSRCGAYMPDDALTCDHCGTLLSEGRPKETGVRAMRQGRVNAIPPVLNDQPRSHVPEYGDYEMSSIPLQPERGMRQKPVGKGLDSFASRPSTHRGVPVRTSEQARHIHTKRGTYRPVKRHSVNWMLIGVILVGLGILAAAGYWVYMSRTDEGQRATAQKIVVKTTDEALLLATNTDPLVKEQHDEALKQLNKASAQSYWLVGQDEMDIGDVETAIMAYRIADLLDPENYDGLLLLGTAYELNSQDDKAEELYLRLAQTVSPSRSESYTALIRMYQEQERRPEAADMMKLAYENTDKENFRLLRKDYIPLQAEVDLAAGRYELTQEINITSPQGYDIYYTTDDAAELPAGGQLVEGPLHLNEGTVNLRAVCVSGDLSSDPISVTYVIYYPSPAAPRANLAPNTYSKPKTVSLRNGEGDEKEELTIYYTIDGSYPDENSPVYDGNPIKLPNGRVTLRAVAKNKYNKLSSTMEVTYKINAKPYMQKPYSEEDVFGNFQIGRTSIADFKQAFGEPKSEVDTTYLTLENDAKHLEYGWGYAVFILNSNVWQLARIEFTSAITSSPRGVGIGSSQDEVVSAYKDMGQPANPGGGRGLYYYDPDIGKIIQNADGTELVQYSCNTVESKKWVLQYHIQGKRVVKITNYYQP